MLKLYLSLVGSHLDYVETVLYYKAIGLLESVQRRKSKMILIEVFKWYRGDNKGDMSRGLVICGQDRTRNNGFKLEKFMFRKVMRRNCFSNRFVDEWK